MLQNHTHLLSPLGLSFSIPNSVSSAFEKNVNFEKNIVLSWIALRAPLNNYAMRNKDDRHYITSPACVILHLPFALDRTTSVETLLEPEENRALRHPWMNTFCLTDSWLPSWVKGKELLQLVCTFISVTPTEVKPQYILAENIWIPSM